MKYKLFDCLPELEKILEILSKYRALFILKKNKKIIHWVNIKRSLKNFIYNYKDKDNLELFQINFY